VSGEQEGRERVRRVLEDELAQVDSPEKADEVVRRVEQLANGETEEERAQQVAAAPSSAPSAIEDAAHKGPDVERAAEVLTTAAAEAVAPTSDAPAVRTAARQTLGAAATVVPPQTERGRSLLREATLRRMNPLQALDARIFLLVNCLPHPRWLNALAYVITVVTKGGWIWVFGTLAGYLLRVPKSWTAFRVLLPCVIGATWIVEFPIKATFRRKRPFIDIVRALVVGKKPNGWSFPSGHTASSFACAWVLSTVWPRRAPAFFSIASTVGLSRIYAGAHYPGDVTAGALLGMSIAELIRQVAKRLVQMADRG
jgi:undecaprenyl-diphosphatase